MVGKILAASYSEKNVARFALDRGKSPPPICVEFLSMPCYCRRREEESKMSDKFFLGGGNPSTPSLPHCIWLWLDSPRPAPHSSLTHSTVKRRSSCCSCSLSELRGAQQQQLSSPGIGKKFLWVPQKRKLYAVLQYALTKNNFPLSRALDKTYQSCKLVLTTTAKRLS